MPTVPTFAVRETDVSRTANVERNGGHKWVPTQRKTNGSEWRDHTYAHTHENVYVNDELELKIMIMNYKN